MIAILVPLFGLNRFLIRLGGYDVKVSHVSHPTHLKVRMFWVGHGFSCANVMDTCSRKPTAFVKDLQVVQQALCKVKGYEDSALVIGMPF